MDALTSYFGLSDFIDAIDIDAFSCLWEPVFRNDEILITLPVNKESTGFFCELSVCVLVDPEFQEDFTPLKVSLPNTRDVFVGALEAQRNLMIP